MNINNLNTSRLRLAYFGFVLFLAVQGGNLFAQTDKEFWFVAPELSSSHEDEPVLFVFTTTDLPAKVLIQQPANPLWADTTINIPAYSTIKWDVTYRKRKNLIENVYDNRGGIPGRSNKGIHITSNNLITCYYTENGRYNPDIYPLKGRNALGTDFYTPYQTDLYNMYKGWTVPSYSCFDIVFTEDNTYITLDIPAGKRIFNGTTTSAYTGTVVLGPFNKGDTYSGIPSRYLATAPRYTGWGTTDKYFSRSAEDHLVGVRIRTNGKKIAVTVKDDSLKSYVGGSYNEAGDQIVPTSIIGTEYIAMRGQLLYGSLNSTYYGAAPPFNPVTQERVYILATQDATDLYINSTYITTLNATQQYTYEFPSTLPFSLIQTTKPSYCWQITGFGNEVGGAILPPTNVCTGSTQVGFTRGTNEAFYLNIMVRKKAKGGFLLNGAPNALFAASVFTDVPGSQWSVARIGPIPTTTIPVLSGTRISNTIDVFHLGVINGGASSGCRYGYFSDYNPLTVDAFISQSGSSDIRLCYGDSAQIVARGGIFYKWNPTAYLSDPLSPIPVAKPPQSIAYTAYVSGACDQIDSTVISIDVAPKFVLNYQIDTTFGCAPLKVKIHDQSSGIRKYIWDFGDGQKASWYTIDTKLNDTTFYHTYQNKTKPAKKYNLRLIVENTFQCRDTMDRPVNIFPEISSAFTAQPDTVGCHPLSINFLNSSLNPDFYQWEFGDGASSSAVNPGHTFDNIGRNDTIYITKLTTRSQYGCVAASTKQIKVSPYLHADFTVSPAQGCAPYNAVIANNCLGGIKRYEWNFGDGTTSTSSAKTLTHLYNNSTDTVQKRTLRLVIENGTGCLDTLIRVMTIYPAVHAQYSQDQTSGCNELTVKFAHPTNLVPVSYVWDFGDGASSSQTDPTKTFINTGRFDTIYKTRLVATSQYLCKDTFTRNFTVRAYIKADYAIDKSVGCSPLTVNVTNNSLAYPGISNYDWNFGDGSTSNSYAPLITHVFQNNTGSTKIYSLRLIVRNLAGCTDTLSMPVAVYPKITSGFIPSTNAGCNALQVNFQNISNQPVASRFEWNFGDGVSDNNIQTAHLFENLTSRDTVYKVRLIAISPDLCRDTSRADITVFANIKADFDVAEAKSCSPFAITIANHSMGGITSYSWDFKDGSALSPLLTPAHIYINQTLATQQFPLQLIVKNAHGCADTAISNLTVYPEVVAHFQPNVAQGCNPLKVSIVNTSNSVATGFNWSFGDGTYSGDRNPVHIYTNLGPADSAYRIKLQAVSDAGCIQDTSINVTVFAYIHADFKVSEASLCSGVPATFTNASQGGIIQNAWDFESDNSTDLVSGSTLVTHIYTNMNPVTDTIYARLVVKNNHSCYDTLQRPLAIYPKVTAAFSSDTAGCDPLTIAFTNKTLGGNALLGMAGNYDWYFGDGGTSGLGDPAKTYMNYTDTDQVRTVKLVAASEFLCKDSVSRTIHVYHTPKSRFATAKSIDCSPFDLQFTNQSVTSGSTFTWDFGDGGKATTLNFNPVSHTYKNTKNYIRDYNVTLLATTSHGCKDQSKLTISAYPQVISRFTFDSAGCSPFTSQFLNRSVNADYYSWDFNDGKVAITPNTSNRFVYLGSVDTTYRVRLIAESKYDCFDTSYHNITVFGQPRPEFTLDPETQVFKQYPQVTFNNLSYLQPDWNYQWDFGNQTTSTSSAPTFAQTYNHWGNNFAGNTFIVTLVAWNKVHQQCRDTVTHPLWILPPRPEITINNNSPEGCQPYTVNFSISYEYIYQDSIFWDFDDGTYANEKSPVHTFDTAGVYAVRVMVKGDGGISSSIKNVTVYALPKAQFEVNPKLVYLPDQVISTYNTSQNAVSWIWDFGDGTSSTEKEPQHLYKKLGTYDIKQVAYSENGCVDSLTLKAYIQVEGLGSIEFPNAFTPDMTGPGDGKYAGLTGNRINDIFYPKHEGVAEYHLEIYSRWGELLFQTDDINVGWDGYYKQKLCKQDVYVWKAKGKFYNGKEFLKAGDVTLLQKKD